MGKKWKRATHKTLAYLLAVSMILALMPTMVFAEEEANYTAEYEMETVEIVEETETMEVSEIEEETEIEEEVVEEIEEIIVEGSAEDGTMSLVNQAALTPSTEGISLFSVTPTIGTDETNPFYIGTAAVLVELSELVADQATYGDYSYGDAYYIMVDDIELNGNWTPIGSESKKFTGTFDGGGYEISGLYINNNSNNQGLFGYNNGTIKNVTVSGEVTVTGTYYHTGGVVGYNTGTVENCINNATVTGSYLVGGVVGRNITASVSNCYNTGAVTGSGNYVGGVVGQNYVESSGAASVSDCYNTGDITGGNNHTGGVVGGNCVYRGTGTVSNCVSLGNIVSGTSYVGRVVGTNEGTLTNNYAWDGMTGNFDATTGVDTINGGNLTYDSDAGELTGVSAWSDIYSGWGSDMSKLPNGDELPSYITEITDDTDTTVDENATKITTAAELKAIANNLSGSYILMKDIDLEGSETNQWIPIGTFTGTFDGGGFEISGLYINNSNDNQGLFGYSTGTIKNVTVSGFVTGGSNTAGVVGYNTGTVENCINHATVTGTGSVGGVVGHNAVNWSSAYVRYCYNTGDVSGTGDAVGGIVGDNCGYQATAHVIGCYNTGTVRGTSQIGGVVGRNLACWGSGHVYYCYNTGYVSGTGDNIGGVVGYNDGNNSSEAYAYVYSCYNTGYVSGGNNVGGIVGQNHKSIYYKAYTNVYNCASLGDTITGTGDNAGRVIGYNNNGSRSNNYAWSGMAVNGDLVTSDLGTGTNNGADLTYDSETKALTGVTSWSTIFGTVDGWYTDMSALPNGDDFPEYILGATAIYTVDDLKAISTDLSGSYILMNDIALSGTWSPIGAYVYNNTGVAFTGTFDGGGYEISGLYINNNSNYQGLFGYSEGTIKNVTVSGEVTGGSYVGGVVGYNYGGTVENCINNATVTGTSCVGGVVGHNGGTVENCINNASIHGNSSVGGVVGQNNVTSNTASVSNCYNTGAVTGSSYVGGVVGRNKSGYSSAHVYHCYNTGYVSGIGDNVGGVVGCNEGFSGNAWSYVYSCYNTGSVSGGSNVGGIVGQNYRGGTYYIYANVYNCISLANAITGTTNVGRVIGYNGNGTLTNNYAWSGMTAENATLTTATKVANGLDGADLYYSSGSGFYTDSTLTTAFDWTTNVSFDTGVWTIPTSSYQLPTLQDEISQNPLANLAFCTVDFVYFGDVHVLQSVEIGSTVTKPTDVTEVAGYTYNWIYTYEDTDGELVNEVFDFTTTITEDLTLTLVCTLNAPVITVSDLTKVYEKNNSVIIATATHDIEDIQTTYTWYEEVTSTLNSNEGDGNDETIITEWKQVSTTNELTVQYPDDSGTYKVVVAVTDANSSTSTAEQTITVSITNATMTDNTTKTQTVAYTGSALTPSVASATTVDESTATVKYQDTDGNYTLDDIPSYTENGEHTVYYQITADNHNTISDVIAFTITQSDTTFDDSESVSTLKAYNGTTEATSFIYGDTITVQVTPRAMGIATLSSYTEQSANSVALYIDTTQITEPQTVTTGTELTFTIDTTEQQLAIDDNEITAKYVGDGNMADYSDSITVTLAKKALTATVATDTNETSITKVYDGNADFADVALALSGVVTVDTTADDVSATAKGTRASANVNGTATFTASEVTLDGDDAEDYSLETTGVTGTVAITAKDLDSSDIVIGDIEGQVYSGSEIKPEPDVTYGELSLTANADFTYSYGNNIAVAEAADENNPPTVTITAVDGGNYSGNTSRTFAIVKKAEQNLGNIELSQRYTVTTAQTQSLAGLMPEDAGTLVYTVGEAILDGTGITPVFSVDGDGLVTYALTGGSNTDVGKVVYLPIIISSTNYEDSIVTLGITILNKSSSSNYYIKATATGNGTVAPEDEDVSPDSMYKVTKGSDVTFEFDPDSGYEVTDVIVNGSSVGACDEYEFENIIYTMQTIEVVFEKSSSSSDDDDDEDEDEDEDEDNVVVIEVPFVDIDEEHKNYDGIAYVYENSIMAGVSSNEFGGDMSITRGMISAILYRINGSEPVEAEMPFADVAEDQYYLEAVRWGKAAGVMAGVSATEFAPNTAITNEQFITFLYRYANFLGMDMTVEFDYDLSGYAISDYAIIAIAWALENDIIELDDLNPSAEALRGDVATALMNLVEMM